MLCVRFKRVCVAGSAEWMPNRRSQKVVRSLSVSISAGAKIFARAKEFTWQGNIADKEAIL